MALGTDHLVIGGGAGFLSKKIFWFLIFLDMQEKNKMAQEGY